jgi:hypothetical protein
MLFSPLDGGGLTRMFPSPLTVEGSITYPLPLDGGGLGWGCLPGEAVHRLAP